MKLLFADDFSGSGRGRCRAAGRVANRTGTSLSDAARAHVVPGGPRWCARHHRALDGPMAFGPFAADIRRREWLGGGTNIGIEAVVRAPADGYTLLLIPPIGHGPSLHCTQHLSFNFIRDIIPIAMISSLPLVMEVNVSNPAKTVPEFIAWAKANPGKVSMASGGTGSASAISGASSSR